MGNSKNVACCRDSLVYSLCAVVPEAYDRDGEPCWNQVPATYFPAIVSRRGEAVLLIRFYALWIRGGFAAGASTTRAQAGASYYGAMELSGNLWKTLITIGNETGRSFEGTHGNGSLTSDGFADNSDWPGYVTSKVSGLTGSGIRGGNWKDGSPYVRVSDRSFSGHGLGRREHGGGRCVRTEP